MKPNEIVQVIDDAVDEFAGKMSPIQAKLYNNVSVLLKKITVDAEGNIKRTISNLNIINEVKDELSSVVNDPKYQDLVSNIQEAMDDVQTLQDDYYKKLNPDFSIPKIMVAIQEQAFESTVADLTEAGVQSNVVNEAVSILQQNIDEGASFSVMQNKLKDFILGDKETDGKLVSYSRQIMSDTMHMTARKYNSIAVDDLGLKWYVYVGSLKPTSRPFCIKMLEKKYVHQDELAKCARGDIPDIGHVSLEGLMKGTTGQNLIDRCGGWNCGHALIGIPEESVPISIRNKFKKEG